jgi:hypothetical protein
MMKGTLMVSKKRKPELTEEEMNAVLSQMTEVHWQAVFQLLGWEKLAAYFKKRVKELKEFHEAMLALRDDLIAARDRRHPERSKHLKWQQWRIDGLSYGQIVKRHKTETGEEVTRDAVIKAVKRLEKEEEQA